jgi:hypothetical protein
VHPSGARAASPGAPGRGPCRRRSTWLSSLVGFTAEHCHADPTIRGREANLRAVASHRVASVDWESVARGTVHPLRLRIMERAASDPEGAKRAARDGHLRVLVRPEVGDGRAWLPLGSAVRHLPADHLLLPPRRVAVSDPIDCLRETFLGTRWGRVRFRRTRFSLCEQRRRPESNWCKRLCRPLRSHSATAPWRT